MDDPVCGDCGRGPRKDRPGDVFIEMAPGKDRKPWHLCPGCYEDGRKVRIRKPMKAEPISDAFVDALVATGWTEKPDGAGNTIISPPERLTNPAPRRRARS